LTEMCESEGVGGLSGLPHKFSRKAQEGHGRTDL
jgi:hypothetical protein